MRSRPDLQERLAATIRTRLERSQRDRVLFELAEAAGQAARVSLLEAIATDCDDDANDAAEFSRAAATFALLALQDEAQV